MENTDIELIMQKVWDWVFEVGPKVLLALVTLFIGLRIIKLINKGMRKSLAKTSTDPTLAPFLSNIVGWILKVVLFVSIASMVGVQVTSFVAILGAAGLAIGLSLQGSLSNFAGGVLILLFKPFKVGDFIDTGSYKGTVEEIQIFYTKLTTVHNRLIIIPNGDLSNSSLTNFSNKEQVRLDIPVGISYDADIKKAKAVLESLLDDERILKDIETHIIVTGLGDSAVNLSIRIWVKASDYWPLNFDMIERIKYALDDAGIGMPYPQRDVHIYEHKA